VDLQTVVRFVAGGVLLVAGAELLVRGASRLALGLGISPLVIGLTVVAYGTSSPELAVSIGSAYGGAADVCDDRWSTVRKLLIPKTERCPGGCPLRGSPLPARHLAGARDCS
jgi:hypothetical protein